MENLNFVFAMIKIHSQQPKMIFYNIIKQNLDVIYSPNGFKSPMAVFGQKW